jgi:probable HAF family extracellular repeat protein
VELLEERLPAGAFFNGFGLGALSTLPLGLAFERSGSGLPGSFGAGSASQAILNESCPEISAASLDLPTMAGSSAAGPTLATGSTAGSIAPDNAPLFVDTPAFPAAGTIPMVTQGAAQSKPDVPFAAAGFSLGTGALSAGVHPPSGQGDDASLFALASVMPGAASQPSSAPTDPGHPFFRITDLGTLGGPEAAAYGINERGQVAGNAEIPSGGTHAYLYTNGVGTMDLGTLGGGGSFGYALNDFGQVVGGTQDVHGALHAYLYTPGLGVTDLGTSFIAQGINNRDQVVGGSILWTRRTGTIDLNSLLPPGSNWLQLSSATGINDRGEIVGYGFIRSGPQGNGHTHAFLESGGQLIDINPPGAVNGSTATTINASGQVVGFFGDSAFATHAFLYTPGVGFTDLGTPGPQYFGPRAYGINAEGAVVGDVGDTMDVVRHAFLWTPRTGMIDLNNYLPPGSGWTFGGATGINDKFEIVGGGGNPGLFGPYGRAVRLDPGSPLPW